MGMPFQNGSPKSWTAPGFHNSLLGSENSYKALLSMDGYQSIAVEGEIRVMDILFGHLADNTLS